MAEKDCKTCHMADACELKQDFEELEATTFSQQMAYLQGLAKASAPHQDPSTRILIREMLETMRIMGTSMSLFSRQMANFADCIDDLDDLVYDICDELDMPCCADDDDDWEGDADDGENDGAIYSGRLFEVLNATPDEYQFGRFCKNCDRFVFYEADSEAKVKTLMASNRDKCPDCGAIFVPSLDDLNGPPIKALRCRSCGQLLDVEEDGHICPCCGNEVKV